MIIRRDFIKGALAGCIASGLHTQLTASDDSPSQSTANRRKFPHRAKVAKIEDLTHNIKRIRLRQADPKFAFTPGQYVLLRAPNDYVAGFNKRYGTSHKEVYRPYSFASSPGNSMLFDLIIKHYPAPADKDVPPGVVSTYVHKLLAVGDTVHTSEPEGKLYAKNASNRPIVLVAGGVGAAPFVCLLNYWFENEINRERNIYFFLGVRSNRDLLLHDQFTKWSETKKNFNYIPALSHPKDDDEWKGRTGYINVVLDKYFKKPFDANVYLAGPPIMIKFTRQVLKKKGIHDDRIHRDPIRVR
jgi:NAD(P)H-flavin reductase